MRIISDNYINKYLNQDMDYLVIGPVPNAEPCVQVTPDSIVSKDNKLEIEAYIQQLIREYGDVPEPGFLFCLKNTGHDAGVYYETAIMYKVTEDEGQESPSEGYAYNVEAGSEYWDDLSKEFLIKNEYSLLYKPFIPTLLFFVFLIVLVNV